MKRKKPRTWRIRAANRTPLQRKNAMAKLLLTKRIESVLQHAFLFEPVHITPEKFKPDRLAALLEQHLQEVSRA